VAAGAAGRVADSVWATPLPDGAALGVALDAAAGVALDAAAGVALGASAWAAGAAPAASLDAGLAAALGVAGRAAPGRRPRVGVLAPPSAPAPPAMASRSLRATGASTVDDGDFTYSPRSCNLLRTCLLVTPSSFASSWTRALPATTLLLIGGRRRRCPLDLVLLSQHVHGAIFTAGS
jgi:hypothetical protein